MSPVIAPDTVSGNHSGQNVAQEDLLHFTCNFSKLPKQFYARVAPSPLPDPYPVAHSAQVAQLLGLESAAINSAVWTEILTGNMLPPGSVPVAAVYSGHQFGVWAGQLGDGRAILLGNIDHGSKSWEIQLKGAGPTPYSRRADGRAVLRSSIREFLCSEAMHGLGIPTTRALAVTGSDAPVLRENVESAAVVSRVAPSFVRFGSFEHWFYRDQHEELRILADYVIENFYPEVANENNRYQAFLQEVSRRTAELMAHWQAVGFCHGVMNTDNMSILGLTLDYGPFGFMEAFDAGHICNHSDDRGRYAYSMQPQIALWNLYCLGQTLVGLIGSVEATEAALQPYQSIFAEAMNRNVHAKLGLIENLPGDATLIDQLFALLQANRPDFTLFFRRLGDLRLEDATADEPLRDLFIDRAAFDNWATSYRARLRQENSDDTIRRLAMNAENPKYVLRNYLAEVAIRRAREKDFSEIEGLLKVLQNPYDEQPEYEAYAKLPPDWASGLEVSCSS